MPLTPATVSALILPNLLGVSLIGVGTPQLALALGVGVSTWTAKIAIQTVDVGTLGVGKGIPIPILIPPQILLLNLTLGFTAQGILGMMAPLLIQGISTGLSQAYLTALTNTVHAGVGLGAGVATFKAPPAFPDLKIGFDPVGATGEGAPKACRAIAQALESTFSTLILPQPIAGPPSIVPGAGSGFGSIV